MAKKTLSYTPMMQQYLEIKKDYADAIVFFRLGDFYEMFFEDAILGSKELEIALTGRDAGVAERVPMCGIPYHAVIPYAQKLIQKGYKIAIVEQVTEPGNGLVKREVVKLITPGMIMDDGILEASSYNYIGAITMENLDYTLAFADLSTGDLSVMVKISLEDVIKQIYLLNLKEIVIESDHKRLKQSLEKLVLVSIFDAKIDHPLCNDLEGNSKKAVSLLLAYLKEAQKNDLEQFNTIRVDNLEDHLRMDYGSKLSLELTETYLKKKGDTLLSIIDHSITALGSRALKKMMDEPILDIKQLNNRYDTIDELKGNFAALNNLREALKGVYDLRRITSRVATKNANGKDLEQLKQTLSKVPMIINVLGSYQTPILKALGETINPLTDIYDLLESSIEENPPLTIKEGGLIKEGYHVDLDHLKHASQEFKAWLIDFENEEKERTGIKNLKVGYNRVFGYYIEVTKGSMDLVKPEFGYERRQTLSTGERYISPILKEKEAYILSAGEKEIALEYQLFIAIRLEVSTATKDLQILSDQIAHIDAMASLALHALNNHYVRPNLTTSRKVHIVNGRHPVVEKSLKEPFISNDIDIIENGILLITGPNMSGKSTYMRMFAQMVILAQMGSFVPADQADMPIFDAIYTRIGASDDLSAGQSTFMVEMLEANEALRHATKDSLILFDEIGRGTATYDGMALAQSIIEYVHEKVKSTTLFSTHYHELTILEKTLKRLKNISVMAVEEKHSIVFMHKIKEGPTDKSYGINVAELAKLPKSLIYRASEILTHLESDKGKKALVNLFNFDHFEQTVEETVISKAEQSVLHQIKTLEINDLSPLEALILLKSLQDDIK